MPGKEDWLDAWAATVAAFGDRDSRERRALDARLTRSSRLSEAGLDAALRCILHGVRLDVAERLLARADPALAGGHDLIVLPSNIPALVLQPLLRSLAAGRSVLVKSPSSEPHFAPAFLAALRDRAPALLDSIRVMAWRGGDRSVEDPILERADRVIAYGDQSTIDSLRRRAPGKVWAHGPKTSLALVAADADLDAATDGISRDVALFDQRGCLSVAAVYVEGDAERCAGLLARALERRAAEWPPGPPVPGEAAAVQQLRLAAQLAAAPSFLLEPLAAGTVLCPTDARFEATPGLRTVRVRALRRLEDVRGALAPWRGRLQGTAITGGAARSLISMLEGLGVSRVAAVGDLQGADASWDDATGPPAE